MDVLNEKQRSYNMSRIKAKNTKPEIILRKALFRNGMRGYRIHYSLYGKPDIVFTKYKLAIFMDGCFWHKCPKCFITPETRTEFWLKKIENNKQRDKIINEKLSNEGWVVLRYWEHMIEKKLGIVLNDIQLNLKILANGRKSIKKML